MADPMDIISKFSRLDQFKAGAKNTKVLFLENIYLILLVSTIFLIFIASWSFNSSNNVLGWIAVVIGGLLQIGYIVFYISKKMENIAEDILGAIIEIGIPVLFIIGLILIGFASSSSLFTIDTLLSSFMFFTIFGVCILVIFKLLILIIFPDKTTFYKNREGVIKSKAELADANINDPEKSGYSEIILNSGLQVLFFKVIRTFAVTAYLSAMLWVLVASPFSFFGGSLYGGIMQTIIAIPLMLLLSSFWTSGNNLSLIMIIAASFGTYMLSFMFPTLFANLWILSTTSSASAGASTISSFGSISPLSYYKSTYIVKTGQTEKRIGPTYELISDDVVTSTFNVLGRLCDESIIVASITFQNRAKYELKDLSVQMSALKSPYCFNPEDDWCNICAVNFTAGNKGSTYTEPINNLPKGVPKTVNVPFTTWLPADVMNQVCKIRSNILVHYHTTSVFPLSFIDYDAYLTNPKNIGNPLSTSSFGKVLMSMDVGQQPVVVNFETKENDQILLKMAWSQKGDGLVNSPKVVLFLPEDLGECTSIINTDTSYAGSLSGVQYTGIYGYNRDKTKLFETTDFECSNYLSEAERNFTLSIEDYCNSVFSKNINSALAESAQASESLLYFTPEYSSSFEGMPSFNDACEDLSSKGYSVCVARRDVSQSELLLCALSLKDIDVSEIDLTTYLIRADALYSFNSIREEQFAVDNCNAI